MADTTISTKRDDSAAEARPVFDDMRRLLERILEDEELQLHMGVDLYNEIDALLNRAASLADAARPTGRIPSCYTGRAASILICSAPSRCSWANLTAHFHPLQHQP